VAGELGTVGTELGFGEVRVEEVVVPSPGDRFSEQHENNRMSALFAIYQIVYYLFVYPTLKG
jgi:hypothetical protein